MGDRKILYLDSTHGIVALMVLFSHFIGAINWELNLKMLLLSAFFLFIICGLNSFLFPFLLGIFISANIDSIYKKWMEIDILLRWFILICITLLFYSSIILPEYLITIFTKIFINLTSIGASGILLLILCSSKIQNLLNTNAFVFIGKISFGIYLWHFLSIFVLMRYLELYGLLSVLFGVLILTILFATITYYLIEKPFIKFCLYFISFIK